MSSRQHGWEQCRPRFHLAVTDLGEPAKTRHISKMVLSIVKFGGRLPIKGEKRLAFLCNSCSSPGAESSNYRDRSGISNVVELSSTYQPTISEPQPSANS